MTCKPPTGCGYEFCWLCLGPWKEHNDKTGSFVFIITFLSKLTKKLRWLL